MKQGTRISLYAGTPIANLFEDYSGKVSPRINIAVDRYLLICRYHGLNLNKAEINVLNLAFKGKKVTSEMILDYQNEILEVSNSEAAHTLINKIESAKLADFIGTLDDLEL